MGSPTETAVTCPAIADSCSKNVQTSKKIYYKNTQTSKKMCCKMYRQVRKFIFYYRIKNVQANRTIYFVFHNSNSVIRGNFDLDVILSLIIILWCFCVNILWTINWTQAFCVKTPTQQKNYYFLIQNEVVRFYKICLAYYLKYGYIEILG